jgi:hypothetical protein
VDRVRYNDKAPWPAAADGSGASLQRRAPFAYGDDPANWAAAVPTPGADFLPAAEPPAFVGQPQPRTILASEEAVFTVAVAGSGPVQVQWLFSGSPLPGATNLTLRLTNVQPAQAGDYAAAAYNQAGSALSASARLTVNRQPTILQQPASQSVRAGGAVTFSVVATGNGALRYQWRQDGLALPGATSATLTLTNLQLTQDGNYSVVVTDNVGPITSAPARLTLLVLPVIIQPPLSQSVVPGSTVTLSVQVTNTANLPIGYLWRTNGRFWLTNVLFERTAFLTLTNVRAPFTNYVVVVTNPASAGLVSTPAAILTLLADSDGDGLPDDWELAHGFPTNSTGNPLRDFDGDGLIDRDEYTAGTDPTDPASYLKLQLQSSGPPARLLFGAVSNRTYTIEFNDVLGAGPWSPLIGLPARSSNRTETLLDPAFTTNRLYRVRTPAR